MTYQKARKRNHNEELLQFVLSTQYYKGAYAKENKMVGHAARMQHPEVKQLFWQPSSRNED
jgi:hypothetical protein